nr:hypothetical protein [Nostoc sp. EkiNYC01]
MTAVVSVETRTDEIYNAKSYSISFTTELRSPYCVQLADPVLLNAHELAEIKAISDSGNIESWNALVRQLRSCMVNRIDWVQCTLDLGEADQLPFANGLNPVEYSEFSNVDFQRR